MKIGILLKEQTSSEPVGLIEFDPSGMLIVRGFEGGLHPYALNSVVKIMEENGLDKPLYVKYADILKQQPALSYEILEREASHYANLLNKLETPLQIGEHYLTAASVSYSV